MIEYYGKLPRINLTDCAVSLAAVGLALTVWRPRAAASFWAIVGAAATSVAVGSWIREQQKLYEWRVRRAAVAASEGYYGTEAR